MTSYTNRKTNDLVKLSLFVAIIILQSWVPLLGYIAIPPLSITFIQVTVIIATLWLGIGQGIIVGFTWGLNSLIRAYVMPTSPLYIYVFRSPLVTILPRVLMPLVVGLVAHYLLKNRMNWRANAMISGILGSLLNTVLVLGAIALFRRNEYLSIQGASLDSLWTILGGLVLVNGIPEMIASAILTPAILLALRGRDKSNKK